MALQETKYKELVDAAQSQGVTNLQVREQDNVLYIDGIAPSGSVKDALWATYEKIDPDFKGGDLILNIDVSTEVAGSKVKVTTEKSNLNIRKGPGTDQPIVGKAAHHELVTLISKTTEQWWLIRTDKGEEGYAYANYLSAEN
ncbi:MAG: SH3 domain-containing protein [Chitinophagaceae bacterium]|nr:MAG: SH3 domain-containing protein [Chitinophagaceae bacterium]